MSYSNILIADIGNSRVKFKSNHEIIAFDYFTDELNHFLNNFKKESAQVFYYSSVNKDAEKFIVENLEHKIETIENAHSLINYQNPIDFTNIKGMGTDRMLSLLAVEKVTDSPLVTVDCGTAVTVNLLDEDNICLGCNLSWFLYSK